MPATAAAAGLNSGLNVGDRVKIDPVGEINRDVFIAFDNPEYPGHFLIGIESVVDETNACVSVQESCGDMNRAGLLDQPQIFANSNQAIGDRQRDAAFLEVELRKRVVDGIGGCQPRGQVEAVERLARHGAVSENVLLKHYTARTPAASGGIWDRAEAVQRFDVAMTTRDPVGVSRTLPDVWQAMQKTRSEIQFAKLYGSALQDLPLSGAASVIAFEVGLLSPDYEGVAIEAAQTEADFDPFLIAIARGTPQNARAMSPRALAIQSAFDGTPPPEQLQTMVNDGKLGEALLRALALFDAGAEGDLRSVTDALALLRSVGLEDVARRASLQLMILDRAT